MPLSEGQQKRYRYLQLKMKMASAQGKSSIESPTDQAAPTLGEGQASAIREEYPSERFMDIAGKIVPFAGAFAKKTLPGIAATGLVSAGTEAVRQGIQYAKDEPGADIGIGERAMRIGTAGLVGAGGEGLSRGLFAGARMMAPGAKTATAQIMRGMAGIPEKTAKAVIEKPEILSTALPMEAAKKSFGEFIESTGYKYGPEAVEDLTGEVRVGESTTNALINDTIKGIKQIPGELSSLPENQAFKKELTQKALAARYELGKLLRQAKMGDPKLKAEASYLGTKLDQVDSWLEKQIPGFAEERQKYALATMKEEFNSLFPRNKNLSPDALRMMLAAGGAAGAAATGSVAAVPALAAMSPKMWEYGIRAANAIPAKAISKAGTRLGVGTGAQYGASEYLRQKYNRQ